MLHKYNLQYNKKDSTLRVAQEVISKSTKYIISVALQIITCRSWLAKIKYDQCYTEEKKWNTVNCRSELICWYQLKVLFALICDSEIKIFTRVGTRGVVPQASRSHPFLL